MTLSIYKKKKFMKIMSALVALIFLLNTILPSAALAREGNPGEHTAWYSFGMGMLAGAVTAVMCAIDPVQGAVGSVANDVAGLYAYYYQYSSYGEPMMIGGLDTHMSKGQFWSSAFSVGASVGAGLLEGALSSSASQAGESTAESAAESAAETAAEAAANAGTSTLKSIATTVARNAVEIALDILLYIPRQIIKLLKLIVRIAKFLYKLITHPIKTLKETLKNLSKKLSDKWKAFKEGRTRPKNNKYFRYGANHQWGRAFASMTGDMFMKLFKQYIAGMVRDKLMKSKSKFVKRNHLNDETLASMIGEVVAMYAAMFVAPYVYRLTAMLGGELDEVLGKGDKPDKVELDAQGGGLKKDEADALQKKDDARKALSEAVNSENVDQEKLREFMQLDMFDESDLSPEELARKKELGDKLGDKVAGAVHDFTNAVKTLENMFNISGETDFMRNINGSKITGFGGLRQGLEMMRLLGAAPLVSLLVRIILLAKLKYYTHYGDNRDKIYENLWKIAVADLFGNFAAGLFANWDGMNWRLAGKPMRDIEVEDADGKKRKEEVRDNPFKTRANLSFGEYALKSLVSETSGAIGQIAWGKYLRDHNMRPDAFNELLHLGVTSVVSGIINLTRLHPGTAPKTEHGYKGADGEFHSTDDLNKQYPKGDGYKWEPDPSDSSGRSIKIWRVIKDAQGNTVKDDIVFQGKQDVKNSVRPLDPEEKEPYKLTVGRFFGSMLREFNNRAFLAFVQASFANPFGGIATGLAALQQLWGNQDKSIQHVSMMAQGGSPMQATLGRLTGNLSNQANEQIVDTTTAAFSPLWLGRGTQTNADYKALKRKLENGTYVIFGTPNDVLRKEQERLQAELTVVRSAAQDLDQTPSLNELLAQKKAAQEAMDKLKEEAKLQKDKLEALTKEIEELRALQAENPGDETNFDQLFAKGSEFQNIEAKIKALEQEKANIKQEMQQKADSLSKDYDAAVNSIDRVTSLVLPFMARQEMDKAVVEGILSGSLSFDQFASALQRIQEVRNSPEFQNYLRNREKTSLNRLNVVEEQMDRNSTLLGLLPLVGMLGNIISGISFSRSQARPAEMWDYVNGGYQTLYEDWTTTKSPTNLEKNPALKENFIRFLQKELPWADENVGQAVEKTVSEGSTVRRRLVSAGVVQPIGVYGRPVVADAQLRAARAMIGEARRGSPGLTDADVKELQDKIAGLQGLSIQEARELAIALDNGIILFADAPNPSTGDPNILLSYTRVDSFGRPQETTYYGLELNGTDWQQVQVDKNTKYYNGPFGVDLTETVDYSQMRLPEEWPTQTNTETKSETKEVPGEEKTQVVYENVPVTKERLVRKKIETPLLTRLELDLELPNLRTSAAVDDQGIGSGAARTIQLSKDKKKAQEELTALGVKDGEQLDSEGNRIAVVTPRGDGKYTFTPSQFSREIGSRRAVSPGQEQKPQPEYEWVKEAYTEMEPRPKTVMVPGESKLVTETTTVEKKVDGHYSVGPNVSYSINNYEIGKGKNPYAGPSGSLDLQYIKSGPMRQAGLYMKERLEFVSREFAQSIVNIVVEHPNDPQNAARIATLEKILGIDQDKEKKEKFERDLQNLNPETFKAYIEEMKKATTREMSANREIRDALVAFAQKRGVSSEETSDSSINTLVSDINNIISASGINLSEDALGELRERIQGELKGPMTSDELGNFIKGADADLSAFLDGKTKQLEAYGKRPNDYMTDWAKANIIETNPEFQKTLETRDKQYQEKAYRDLDSVRIIEAFDNLYVDKDPNRSRGLPSLRIITGYDIDDSLQQELGIKIVTPSTNEMVVSPQHNAEVSQRFNRVHIFTYNPDTIRDLLAIARAKAVKKGDEERVEFIDELGRFMMSGSNKTFTSAPGDKYYNALSAYTTWQNVPEELKELLKQNKNVDFVHDSNLYEDEVIPITDELNGELKVKMIFDSQPVPIKTLEELKAERPNVLPAPAPEKIELEEKTFVGKPFVLPSAPEVRNPAATKANQPAVEPEVKSEITVPVEPKVKAKPIEPRIETKPVEPAKLTSEPAKTTDELSNPPYLPKQPETAPLIPGTNIPSTLPPAFQLPAAEPPKSTPKLVEPPAKPTETPRPGTLLDRPDKALLPLPSARPTAAGVDTTMPTRPTTEPKIKPAVEPRIEPPKITDESANPPYLPKQPETAPLIPGTNIPSTLPPAFQLPTAEPPKSTPKLVEPPAKPTETPRPSTSTLLDRPDEVSLPLPSARPAAAGVDTTMPTRPTTEPKIKPAVEPRIELPKITDESTNPPYLPKQPETAPLIPGTNIPSTLPPAFQLPAQPPKLSKADEQLNECERDRAVGDLLPAPELFVNLPSILPSIDVGRVHPADRVVVANIDGELVYVEKSDARFPKRTPGMLGEVHRISDGALMGSYDELKEKIQFHPFVTKIENVTPSPQLAAALSDGQFNINHLYGEDTADKGALHYDCVIPQGTLEKLKAEGATGFDRSFTMTHNGKPITVNLHIALTFEDWWVHKQDPNGQYKTDWSDINSHARYGLGPQGDFDACSSGTCIQGYGVLISKETFFNPENRQDSYHALGTVNDPTFKISVNADSTVYVENLKGGAERWYGVPATEKQQLLTVDACTSDRFYSFFADAVPNQRLDALTTSEESSGGTFFEIYANFLLGRTPQQIAKILNANERPIEAGDPVSGWNARKNY